MNMAGLAHTSDGEVNSGTGSRVVLLVKPATPAMQGLWRSEVLFPCLSALGEPLFFMRVYGVNLDVPFVQALERRGSCTRIDTRSLVLHSLLQWPQQGTYILTVLYSVRTLEHILSDPIVVLHQVIHEHVLESILYPFLLGARIEYKRTHLSIGNTYHILLMDRMRVELVARLFALSCY